MEYKAGLCLKQKKFWDIICATYALKAGPPFS